MLRGLVNNQVKESFYKESFYRQRKKNQSMLWQFFFISYKSKSDMKTFLRLLTNSLKSLVSISLYLKKKNKKQKTKPKPHVKLEFELKTVFIKDEIKGGEFS